jgi:hypothetical protein
MMILLIFGLWVNLWLPSPSMAEKAGENCQGKEEYLIVALTVT